MTLRDRLLELRSQMESHRLLNAGSSRPLNPIRVFGTNKGRSFCEPGVNGGHDHDDDDTELAEELVRTNRNQTPLNPLAYHHFNRCCRANPDAFTFSQTARRTWHRVTKWPLAYSYTSRQTRRRPSNRTFAYRQSEGPTRRRRAKWRPVKQLSGRTTTERSQTGTSIADRLQQFLRSDPICLQS